MMKNKLCSVFLILFLSLNSISKSYENNVDQSIDMWIHIDFDDSMQTKTFPDAIRITRQVLGIEGDKLLNFFKNLYVQNSLAILKPQAELKIPKIIHQIWLGSPLPEAFKKYIASWINAHLNAGWQYKLWTDEDMKTFKLHNQQYYDETDSFGVKSDLLKWELVYRFGGVYIDMDYECLKPLDVFHYTYDFYTGIQPLDTQFIQLGAALFGGVPGHPIMQHCIETIKNDWHLKGAPTKSGPLHFTKSFYVMAGKNGSKDIALPASYFYPLGCRDTVLKRKEWTEKGAFAVHHWAKSWMPAEYRSAEFRHLNNDHLVSTWNK